MPDQFNILVVDDEPKMANLISIIVEIVDKYTVLKSGTSKEALEIVKNNKIDAVLLDILMPEMDGITLLDEIKKISPDTQVIMITAVDEVETAVSAIKKGAFDYIIKPFNNKAILGTITKALDDTRIKRMAQTLKANEIEYLERLEKARAYLDECRSAKIDASDEEIARIMGHRTAEPKIFYVKDDQTK